MAVTPACVCRCFAGMLPACTDPFPCELPDAPPRGAAVSGEADYLNLTPRQLRHMWMRLCVSTCLDFEMPT